MTEYIKTYLPDNFFANLPKKSFNGAVMSAINTMASYYSTMVEDAIAQQFVSTASGKYLLYLGEQNGFSLPDQSGLDISALEILIPTFFSSPKQITSSFVKLVDAFYTDFKTRPNITSSVAGPYVISSGDNLIFESNIEQFEVVVLSSMVANLNNVDPSELAGIINVVQSAIKADAYTDIGSGSRYLRLTCPSSGVGAYLHIIGGSLQNLLQFPQLRGSVFASGTNFLAAKDAPYSDVIRLTWDGLGTSPNLFKVDTGDFVTIRDFFNVSRSPNSLLNGTYQVIESGLNYLTFVEKRSGNLSMSQILAFPLGTTVTVSYPGHGFGDGMRVDVSSASNLISVPDTPITLIDSDTFSYQISAPVSLVSDVLNSVVPSSYYYAKSNAFFSSSSSIVTVTWTNHGLTDGTLISGVCSTLPQFSFSNVAIFNVLSDSFDITLPGVPDMTGFYFAIGVLISVPLDISILVTDQKKIRIYDQSEYAYVAEAIPGESKVLVPAVPPVCRRTLVGATHLHGSKFPITDFTRSSLTLDISKEDGIISVPNTFVITNNYARPDFLNDRQYASSSSSLSSPIANVFSINVNDDHSVFPFTVPMDIGTNPIYGIPGSEVLEIQFPFRHGLRWGWEFTLAVASGSGNLTSAQLSGSHIVISEVTATSIQFKATDSFGNLIVYHGYPILGFDIYQASVLAADGSDFYLQFSSPSAAIASGLVEGSVFSINRSDGVNVFLTYANQIRHHNHTVTSIIGSSVYFNMNVGPGPVGLVISGADGGRSDYFGGDCSYFFDKTSTSNVSYVMQDLYAIPTNSEFSANPNYVGSYIYDPTGSVFPYRLSDVVTTLISVIFKGDSPFSVFVPSVDNFPETGVIYFAYGTSNQEGPVPYRAVISVAGNSQILIDPSYIFKYTHEIGDTVILLSSLLPFVPDQAGMAYPAYLTDTAVARSTLELLLQDISACGILLDFEVKFPALRYSDVSIPPYEDVVYSTNPGPELGLLPTVI